MNQQRINELRALFGPSSNKSLGADEVNELIDALEATRKSLDEALVQADNGRRGMEVLTKCLADERRKREAE